ncbi:hypothetical protein EUGRSUZ_L00347 [Eucalyptus grandis]|uniref:Uncharacterized protein n=2 Tax=Eucalyptus grandis TaxID=71139 RepID=A0ACC3L6B1_EUCGR|nr:hypothetical protein EUGRSUZ_L00347 [Eucalyptus grandis]
MSRQSDTKLILFSNPHSLHASHKFFSFLLQTLCKEKSCRLLNIQNTFLAKKEIQKIKSSLHYYYEASRNIYLAWLKGKKRKRK